jgi:phosphoserine aminotransferase
MRAMPSPAPREPSVPPRTRPADPRFSSGPCRKHPGWSLDRLAPDCVGRSHRSRDGKRGLAAAIDRSRQLLGLPDDWLVAIVPGSATGAFEMAMWALLGPRDIDVLVSDGFSRHWAREASALTDAQTTVHSAECGAFPGTGAVDPDRDLVFVYNGTSTGACVRDLDWLDPERGGLVLCDAASAAFAMPIDFDKLDVVTWSWQKALGGEGSHGMLALGPKAQRRANLRCGNRTTPKLLRLADGGGAFLHSLFDGHTISTPSMLALADIHSALAWAERIGGLPELIRRTQRNYAAVARWVAQTEWIEWLADDPQWRSPASICLRIVDPEVRTLAESRQHEIAGQAVRRLEQEGVAYDIWTYSGAPAGFRIWAGPTVESDDLAALTPWLDWSFAAATRAPPEPAVEG